MNPEVTPEMLQRLWNDPANWKSGMFYFCKADPRVIVPKRSRLGWTINFGRASAVPVLILSGVFTGLPFFLLALYGFAGTWIWWAAIPAMILIVSLVCWYFASP